MQKFLFSSIIVACAATFSYAQNDDYNKADIYAGFSHNRIDFGGDYEGFNGFNVSATGNISRYVGLKGDYALHFKSFDNIINVDARQHVLAGGVQFKDNSTETKVKPFAHLMAGFAHARVSNGISDSETGFAGVIGGGVDIRVSRRVDFRVVQFDYNPTRLGGETQHNFRIGAGIVFR